MTDTLPSKIDVCTACRSPLVWTFLFRGAEFYCLDCGRRYGMFGGQDRVTATPELLSIYTKYRKEFRELAEGYLAPGIGKSDCLSCKAPGPGQCNHVAHATAAELEASTEAHIRLSERAGYRKRMT